MTLLPLGLLAGALTTLAGVGGGMLLVLVLTVLIDPHAALAITAPALLVGNLHRLWLFWREVDRRLAMRFAAGALPASVAAGLLTVELSDGVLRVLLLAVALLAVARGSGLLRWTPPAAAAVPVGGVTGLLSATTGGGGLVMAPYLLSTGLRGEAYVATGTAVAVLVHVGRIAGYGAGGLVTAETLGASAVLAVALVAGNLGGRRLRSHLSERSLTMLTWGTLGSLIALAILGVA